MKLPTLLAAMLSSALAGALLVVACSDDAPGDADAAVCDCPAAEPPVPGRIRWVTHDVTVPAMNSGIQTAGCPAGAKLLGGGCNGSGVGSFDVVSAYPFDAGDQQAFVCEWQSSRNEPTTVTATAICLVP